MDISVVFNFLHDLRDHNDKEWFQSNKSRYQEALAIFEQLLENIIPGIIRLDPSVGYPIAKQCIFRIYRDIRFSRDKTPYKTNFGGFISQGGRSGGRAGYYIHLEPQNSFVAGGVFMPPADVLKKIREHVFINIQEFLEIVRDHSFIGYFGSLAGDQLAKIPRGFPEDFIHAEYIRYKSYHVFYPLENDLLVRPEVTETILELFQAMVPLNMFLNRAVSK
ncbi:MAG: DUF2461 domain-containing protein [Bacteroidales bacterium]|nr:DUF2461 domain-containing protein [Bacteroidales bacterium]